jgi:hypothetical protein
LVEDQVAYQSWRWVTFAQENYQAVSKHEFGLHIIDVIDATTAL